MAQTTATQRRRCHFMKEVEVLPTHDLGQPHAQSICHGWSQTALWRRWNRSAKVEFETGNYPQISKVET